MNKRAFVLLVISSLLSGCYTTDAINRNYDLSRVRRIGVLAFDYGRHQPFGAEDIFAKHLLKRGYHVVERVRLESIMREQKLSITGILSPDSAKNMGKILGVDVVVLGQITTYVAERKMLMVVDSQSTREEPVFEKKKEKNAEGKMVVVTRQIGVKVTRVTKQIPFMMPVEAEVGLAVKLVDVESGEMVWIGSDTNQGINVPLAMEGIASYLVKRLSKKWRPQRP